MFKLPFKKFIVKNELLNSKSFLTNVDYLAGLFNKSLQSIKKTHFFLEKYPEFLTVFSKISGLDFQTAFAINSIYSKNIKPLAFGILAPIINKNLLVLDKIEYFESIFFTPAYLFFISLLSASFLFFTNQPVPIVDQDGVISISARIQECDKNLSLRFALDKLNNNLTLPALLILKDSIIQIPKSFDFITNYFMAYEDIVQNKLKAIENQENTRFRQMQIIGSWKIIINEKERIEETLQNLRDFNSISNRPLNQQEISIIPKNSINGVLSDLQKVKNSSESFEHEVLIKKQMNLFKTSLIETDLWSKNSEDKIISYKK